MSAATDTTNHENVLTQKKGNHKGCPYQKLAGLFSEEVCKIVHGELVEP